jgi:ElaB/YqjD/DUF883 family membrane-anchored ribosome-binding protein
MTRNGITETLGDRVSQLKQSMRGIVEYGSDRASDIKGKLADAKDVAVGGATSVIAKTGKLIKQHPFIAIGVAFGLGYVVMRMARRK